MPGGGKVLWLRGPTWGSKNLPVLRILGFRVRGIQKPTVLRVLPSM